MGGVWVCRDLNLFSKVNVTMICTEQNILKLKNQHSALSSRQAIYWQHCFYTSNYILHCELSGHSGTLWGYYKAFRCCILQRPQCPLDNLKDRQSPPLCPIILQNNHQEVSKKSGKYQS